MTDVRPYPFDLTELRKGSWITPEECERVGGVRRTDVKLYGLALLRVKDALERQWLRERTDIITVRTSADGLLICTDDDAVKVNEQRYGSGVSTIRRAFVRQNGVDRRELTSDDTRSLHERSVLRIGAFLAGAKQAVRVALRPTPRSTPGLPSK